MTLGRDQRTSFWQLPTVNEVLKGRFSFGRVERLPGLTSTPLFTPPHPPIAPLLLVGQTRHQQGFFLPTPGTSGSRSSCPLNLYPPGGGSVF